MIEEGGGVALRSGGVVMGEREQISEVKGHPQQARWSGRRLEGDAERRECLDECFVRTAGALDVKEGGQMVRNEF